LAKLTFDPARGFNWRKVTWGRPDAPRSVLCSYCSAVIPDDGIPLIMWTSEGYAAQFCDECQSKWFRMRG
jgi:hypothetical protein